MAFNEKSLSRQTLGAASAEGNAGHSSIYMYRTAEAFAAVMAAGFFNNARPRLKKGDIIDIVSGVGATVAVDRIKVDSVPSTGNVLVSQVNGPAGTGGLKIARGQETINPNTAATATVVTGLAAVVAVVASLDSDPDGTNIAQVSATIGDQAGAPDAGSVILKTWKITAADNGALVAASADQDYKVNWIAIGL